MVDFLFFFFSVVPFCCFVCVSLLRDGGVGYTRQQWGAQDGGAAEVSGWLRHVDTAHVGVSVHGTVRVVDNSCTYKTTTTGRAPVGTGTGEPRVRTQIEINDINMNTRY